jgi:DNA-directed RNA polymerase specialized sigma24 family protein
MKTPSRLDRLSSQLVTDLHQAIRQRRGALRRFALSEADIDDLCQDVLLRLFLVLARGEPPRSLGALVATALRNAAIDVVRARRRHGYTLLDSEEFARALDEEGLRAAAETTSAPQQRAATWERLGRDVEAYVARANEGRHPRGHHVRAWWCVRIEGEEAAAVAKTLGAPSRELVWQWCTRGRDRVLTLAREDDDRARAERMLCAVEVTRAAG